MGYTAAPWRVTATAISRANASVDMPLLEEDFPQLIHRAARVEEMHGKCVKNFRIHLAKHKQDDILQARGRKRKPNGPDSKHKHRRHRQGKREPKQSHHGHHPRKGRGHRTRTQLTRLSVGWLLLKHRLS